MAGFIGAKASIVANGAERKQTYAITKTTTSLTGLAYTPTKVHVFHNGIRLVDGTDYTATNGTSITLTTAAEDGDEVVVISYATFQTSDTVSAANGGTFAGNLNTVDIRPTTDDNNDLGTSSKRFQDLYLSGGLYLGGTGSANKLDDYEEGTWTPTVTTGTVSAFSGGQGTSYVKIGKMVHLQFYIGWTNTVNNNVGLFTIGGLPFVPSSNYGAFALGYSGSANINDFAPTFNYGAASIYFHQNDGTAATISNSDVHSRSLVTIIGSGCYVTDA